MNTVPESQSKYRRWPRGEFFFWIEAFAEIMHTTKYKQVRTSAGCWYQSVRFSKNELLDPLIGFGPQTTHQAETTQKTTVSFALSLAIPPWYWREACERSCFNRATIFKFCEKRGWVRRHQEIMSKTSVSRVSTMACILRYIFTSHFSLERFRSIEEIQPNFFVGTDVLICAVRAAVSWVVSSSRPDRRVGKPHKKWLTTFKNTHEHFEETTVDRYSVCFHHKRPIICPPSLRISPNVLSSHMVVSEVISRTNKNKNTRQNEKTRMFLNGGLHFPFPSPQIHLTFARSSLIFLGFSA